MNGYLRRDFFQVDGYTSHFDACLFDLFLETQSRAGVAGSMAEIGVHHGRSFFVLAQARQAGEKALAIDVFEDDAIYQDPKGLGRGVRFRQNCTRLGVALDDSEVFAGFSTALAAAEIRRRVGTVRFFSVDGGHRYDDVAHDIRLAAAPLHPRGIIVADDFINPQWPEVTLAVAHWLREPGNPIAPFLCTPSKLYLCPRADKSFYQAAASQFLDRSSSVVHETELFEERYLYARQTATAKLREFVTERLVSRLPRHARPPAPATVSPPAPAEAAPRKAA